MLLLQNPSEYLTVFTLLMLPVTFHSYIQLFIKYLMKPDTALDTGNAIVSKTHMGPIIEGC